MSGEVVERICEIVFGLFVLLFSVWWIVIWRRDWVDRMRMAKRWRGVSVVSVRCGLLVAARGRRVRP